MIADPAECSFQFNPVGTVEVHELVRHRQERAADGSVSYDNVAAPAGTVAQIKVGDTVIETFDGKACRPTKRRRKAGAFKKALGDGAQGSTATRPRPIPTQINRPMTW